MDRTLLMSVAGVEGGTNSSVIIGAAVAATGDPINEGRRNSANAIWRAIMVSLPSWLLICASAFTHSPDTRRRKASRNTAATAVSNRHSPDSESLEAKVVDLGVL